MKARNQAGFTSWRFGSAEANTISPVQVQLLNNDRCSARFSFMSHCDLDFWRRCVWGGFPRNFTSVVTVKLLFMIPSCPLECCCRKSSASWNRRSNLAEVSTAQTGSQTPTQQHNIRFIFIIKQHNISKKDKSKHFSESFSWEHFFLLRYNKQV